MKRIDLGQGHAVQLTDWVKPDVKQFPQFAELQPFHGYSAVIHHLKPGDESPCVNKLVLDGPVQRATAQGVEFYQATSLDPLTLVGVIVCPNCGDRGTCVGGVWKRV